MELSLNELQFMTVLWCADAPLTSTEILKRSVDRAWKDTSLHTILNNLLEKGAVAEHGFIKDGKSISRTFIAALSCEKYYQEFFSKYPIKIITTIVSVLMSRPDIDAETMVSIEKTIRDKREETYL